MRNIVNKKKHINFYLFVMVFCILGILILFIQLLGTGQVDNIPTQSAFDQFSIGHFVMGTLICVPFLIILERNRKKKKDLLFIIMIAFASTVMISIAFELFENSEFFVNVVRSKYNNQADSLLNSSTDVILNIFGASLLCYIYWILYRNKKK